MSDELTINQEERDFAAFMLRDLADRPTEEGRPSKYRRNLRQTATLIRKGSNDPRILGSAYRCLALYIDPDKGIDFPNEHKKLILELQEKLLNAGIDFI